MPRDDSEQRGPGHGPGPRLGLGRWAESRVVRHLESSGIRVVDRNYRGSRGEIDLVAVEGSTVVFLEVKARRGLGFGSPAASVDRRKRERIRATAIEYLAERRPGCRAVRFDVVGVLLACEGNDPIIEHRKGAF